jgi:adenine-specific DNA-methyltransferase
MNKITPKDAESHSPDIAEENVQQLSALFPEVVSEGGIDYGVLRELLGESAIDQDEKYGLTWHGKRSARQLALTPSLGTLLPCPAESVDWVSTSNIMIEGDNLEVLKLLQRSYAGAVKLIYIDPPYNTGRDLIYPDNFQDGIANYLGLTGQLDGDGRRLSSNAESSGRFHTHWLNMMYPRLRLARSLLQSDGVLFVSIDDNEAANLRMLCDEIFGAENFVADITVVNNLKGRNDKRYIATANERLMMYVKSPEFEELGLTLPEARLSEFAEQNAHGAYRLLGLRKRGGADTRAKRPNMFFPIYVDPADMSVHVDKSPSYSVEVWPRKSNGSDGCWRWGQATVAENLGELMGKLMADGRIDVFQIDYLNDADGALRRIKPKSVMQGSDYSTDGATKAFRQLFPEASAFSNPKPIGFLSDLIDYAVGPQSHGIVLDFFAGSGTTGHAVLARNALDDGNRRYILVQLPEPLSDGTEEERSAIDLCDRMGVPRTLSELTKERLRRAALSVGDDNPLFKGDTGFRVFKLASSNIRSWDASPDDTEQALLDSVEHLRRDRTEEDILYELLLKLGLDLAIPIERRDIAARTVYNVGAGTLIACLAESIGRSEIEELALGIASWRDELNPAADTVVVFRDSAFVDDVAKTNITAILEQHGMPTVRSL